MPVVATRSTALANDSVWHLVDSTTSRRVPWSAVVNGEEGLELQSITAIPAVHPTPALAHNVRLLTRVRRLTKLVLSFNSLSSPTEVFGVLSIFEYLEELEITFQDVWRTLEVFPQITSLRTVTIKNVTLSEAALNSLAANTNLHTLRLQNVHYVGSLNALQHLKNLRRLEITGDIPALSRSISFLDAMPGIKEVSLETSAPSEEVLETLRKCQAEISLKLHGRCITAFSSELSTIQNLTDLIFVTTCCLRIPPEFQALSKLRSVSFVDHQREWGTPIGGIENLPPSATKLSMDLDKIHLPENPFPDQLTSTITELVIRMPNIGTQLGLSRFTNLQRLQLLGTNELDGEVLQELTPLKFLEDLTIGGGLNSEEKTLRALAQLALKSLSISNSTITPDSLSAINRISSLQTLALRCCFFLNCNIDSLADYNSPENLILDRCTQIEGHLLDVLTSPFIIHAKSLQVGLSKVLSVDQLRQLHEKQQELGLVLLIEYFQNG